MPRIREICDKYDVLLVPDEVITGFGRTGIMFRLEHRMVQLKSLKTNRLAKNSLLPSQSGHASSRQV